MSRYVGETYNVPLEQGGFCHNKNIDTIAPVDMVHPSCNIWLNEGGVRKRGGTALVDTMSGGGDVSGIYDFNLINTNQFILRHTTDGKIWKNETDTIKTGWTADKIAQFSQHGDSVMVCNGANCPTTWDGGAGDAVDLTSGVKAQGTITMNGVATAGVAAQGTITMSGIATAYQTFVVDDQLFTWKNGRKVKGDVKMGADAAAAIINLAEAIGEDLDSVTSVDNSATTVTITATSYGTDANSMVFTEASDNMAMDGSGTLGGTTAGVNEETFVIDDQTFTWKTEREEGATGEVTIGAHSLEAVDNLIAAINEDMDVVEAIDGTHNTVTITATSYGTDANSMVFTEASGSTTMDGSGTLGGSTTGVVDQIPSDWTGSNYPTQMIVHGRGNSVRRWALGCPLNPETIYVTTNGNLTDFAQATVLTFDIATGHAEGIIGGVEYGDKLLLFGKKKSFIFNDESTDITDWGYELSQWSGGAANHRLIVKTPNDIVCMMEDGEIYSVSAAQEYGDYRAASLTRPSFLHEWIKTYVNLSRIDDFHAIYDPVLRAVKIFVAKEGGADIDMALVYFIDRPPDKAWVILNNEDYTSGYAARSSCLVRQSAGKIKIYTGGYAGKVWRLGETNRNDNDNAFMARYKTPAMSFQNARESKRYDQLKVVSVAEGSCNVTATWWVDEEEKGNTNMDFSVSGGVLGAFILGTSVLGGQNLIEESVRLGCLGKRLQLEVKNAEVNEDFFLSQFFIDFIPLGKRI